MIFRTSKFTRNTFCNQFVVLCEVSTPLQASCLVVFIYVVGEIQKDSLNKVGKLADISIVIFTKNDGNERRKINLQAK